jgi:hypothetical protein
MAQRYDLDFQELSLNGSNLSITKGNTITLPFANFYLASNPNGYLSSVSFSQILSKPTTIAGYGITDIPTALSYFNNDVSFITSSALTEYLKITNAASTYAPINNPTFTGTVSGITKSMIGLSLVDNTSDAGKPISTATQTALNNKENSLGNPSVNGYILSSSTSGVRTWVAASSSSGTSWGLIAGTLSSQTDLQNALNAKENTITAGTTAQYYRGDKTFQTLDKTAIGLGNVDNTSDANKPVSTAMQTALDTKQIQLNGTGFVKASGTTITYDNNTYLTTSSASSIYAPLASPTFTGTISGITKSMVGLGSVDNTTDAAKPISTATQTALDLKLTSTTAASTYLPISNPTATGTLTTPTIANTLGANFATSSGSVGIGTASPSSILHTVGTIQTSSTSSASSNYANRFNNIIFSRFDVPTTFTNAISNSWSGTATDQTMNFEIGNGSSTRVTAMSLLGNGNVGIGTTAPAYKLDVSGSFNANSIYTKDNQSGYAGNYGRYSVAYPYATFSTSGAWGYDWQINGSSKMMMFSSGNIGIGTTTDLGYKLDLNGTARVIGTTQFNGNVGIGAVPSTQSLNVYSTTNDIAFQGINAKTTGSNYAVAGTAVGVGGTINMGGYFYADGASTNHGIRVYNITAAANNYALFIDSPAQSYFQGNVGIGTTAPSQKLNIAGTGYVGALIQTSTTTAGALCYLSNATRSFSIGARGDYGSTGQFNIVDETAGVLRLSVSTAGNVLIGSSASDAGYKLDVQGTSQATQFKLSALNTAPASATATGVLGEIRVDASYIYICTATNTWKRSAITTW